MKKIEIFFSKNFEFKVIILTETSDFLCVYSHELDVEESPQLTPDEAWSKLGLKRSPKPL